MLPMPAPTDGVPAPRRSPPSASWSGWALRGNPFSSANEVAYRDVVVASVTGDADQLCWSDDPDRRDAPQTCAILALDPELEVPAAGDVVTIGVVELRPPDGAELRQVVYVAPAAADAPVGTDVGTPTPSATE
jgi:hypothetical protein